MRGLWIDTFPPSPLVPTLPRGKTAYTIKLLRLNDRESLARGRRSAFKYYRDGLADYLRNKVDKASVFRESLQHYPHRTVWEEMKRQRQHRPGLREFFNDAGETLAW